MVLTEAIGLSVIDVDIHCRVPSHTALFPYLAEHWREYMTTSSFRGPTDTNYPDGAPTTVAQQFARSDGKVPGGSLAEIQRDVLDAFNVEAGILNCDYALDSLHNPDTAAAMARAINDWLIHEWLTVEPRLRATMMVSARIPEDAAAEIDRVGGHPGIVQVLLPVRSETPYGSRRYLPIFEAAARNDLVVSLQFGGAPGNAPTPTGWPSYYVEEYVGMAHIFQSQILSLIVEGVFDRFPTLKMAMIEGGWTWLPSLMWRIDKDWKGLRRETPWNTMLPSEYIRERMRFSLQPLDASPEPRHMLQVLEELGSDELLMFSTDYPHWHFSSPDEAMIPGLPEPLRRKILAENARNLYGL